MRVKQVGLLITLAGFCILCNPNVFAVIYTVDPNGNGHYPTIQVAIDAVVHGDIITVFPGTYYENVNFNGKNIILMSTAPEDPNVVAATIINGQQTGSVVRFSGSETSDCILGGFTITNGYPNNHGGGIDGNGTQATVSNCIIRNNTSDEGGGGLCDCDGSITNCTITGNAARFGGGLFWCFGTITNCTITGNTAEVGGGLAAFNGCITNCTITSNMAAYEGGGLYDCNGSITNCIVTDNTSDINGGGLFGCVGTITNCTIVGNTAYNDGGGLYECTGLISNCIICYNGVNQLYGSSTPTYSCICWPVPTYSCIQGWTGGGTGNISSDPLFTDANNGDYHLKSEYGRWNSNTLEWVFDDGTSPCIDAGTPYDVIPGEPNDWQNELWPHGGRINIGAYGGTPQGSMSFNPIGNTADLNHDYVVNMIDWSLWSDDWLLEQSLLDSDFDRDNDVDPNDMTIFMNNWLWGM